MGQGGVVCFLMAVPENGSWILLAEDDKLFTMLFERAWKAAFPGVDVVKVSKVSELSVYCSKEASPKVAVLDRNLEDGSSLDYHERFICPVVLWSSDSSGEVRRKPVGREELEMAIQEIARIGGLVVPPQ